MHHACQSTPSISPALVSATLDCLPFVAAHRGATPRVFIHIALALGATPADAVALVLRFVAAEAVLADRRWSAWRSVIRGSDAGTRRRLDALVIALIATLPLDGALRFDADCFFASLLGDLAVSHGNNDNALH